MTGKNTAAEDITVFSLAGLLNILFRGYRWVIVITALGVLAGVAYGLFTEPLYRSTAQVKPGIVSYTDYGAPIREASLKDIVHWFRSSLFWADMRELEQYDDSPGPPIILAEFIPTGPQSRGGDVVTLTNLSTDPLVALATLDEAIDFYNEQAFSDSLGSTLGLTIGGVRVRMDKIYTDIDNLEAEVQRIDLWIAEQERQLKIADGEIAKLADKLTQLEYAKLWRKEAATLADKQVAAAEQRQALAETLLDKMINTEDSAVPVRVTDDPVSSVLLQVVNREQAGRVGDLLVNINQIGTSILNGKVQADSLREHITDIDYQITSLILERDVNLVQKKGDIQQKIEGHKIRRDIEVPVLRAQLLVNLAAEQVRLDALTPLERVGRVTVSQKPVRPRKMRALLILTFLAFFSSLFLVLAREYFLRNKSVIISRRPV